MAKKKNVFEITIKCTKEELNVAINEAFAKKQKDIKMDGFRKGKVPMDVYFKKAGKESMFADAIDILLPTAYDKALKEAGVNPIIQPRVDIKNISLEDGVEFLFVITSMPEVSIEKYTGLGIKAPDATVTDEEVNHEIEHILERFSELVVKDGKVEMGNVAIIDFEGFKDGVAFEGGKGENYSLEIGSNTFIPGFEEQVVGMAKGETKDINVTFPEDYHSSELKGQAVTFKVTVNEIKEKQKRELDKELFEDLGLPGVDSKESLEKEVRSNIEVNKASECENAYVDSLLKEIAKHTKVEIPEELVHEEIHAMMHRFEEQMKMQGINLDLYFQITKSTPEDLENQMKPEANNHVLYRFIIDTIREKENIKVTEEEASKELEEAAKKYNMPVDEFSKMYGGLEMMMYELEVKKTIEFLKENNK